MKVLVMIGRLLALIMYHSILNRIVHFLMISINALNCIYFVFTELLGIIK